MALQLNAQYLALHVYSSGRYVANIGESSSTGTDVIVSSFKGGRVID